MKLFRLSTGLEVRLVERHALPLASITLVARAGAESDPAGRAGTAELTADLLDEGTQSWGALEIADQVATLGSILTTDADWDAAVISLDALIRNLDRSLEIFREIVQLPSFPKKEFERIKMDRLTRIQQWKAEPRMIVRNVFNAVVYGKDHPYGWPTTGQEETLRAVEREAAIRYHRSKYRTDQATVIVVGDVTKASITPLLERALGSWHYRPAEAAQTSAPPSPKEQSRRFVIVDRPGAPQSEVRIGHASVPRNHPDHMALEVMNTVLGGDFSSRLNHRLREELGYTYGAYSWFSFRRGAGPFVISGAIHTKHTVAALREIYAQLERIRSEPVATAELDKAKNSIIRSMPADFESNAQIASQLASLFVYGLPDDYYAKYAAGIEAVTAEDVLRVAKAHLDPDRLVTVVVGDRKAVAPGIESAKLGPIEYREAEGQPAK